jgi:DNA-binding GntR family transcriptional regulator
MGSGHEGKGEPAFRAILCGWSMYGHPAVYTHLATGPCTVCVVSVHVPLREKAYDRIRAQLLEAGPSAFGGRLVEQQLAAELAMSRTPVRDALRRLAVAGLIEEVAGGGFAPRRPRVRDVREQYDIRLVLELKAAELAAMRPDEERAAALGADAGAPAPEGGAFHLVLADASGNAILARSIATINERCFLLRLGGALDDAVREALRDQHAAVLAAVRRGEPGAACAAMREHLRDAADLAVAAARRLKPAGEGDRA